MELNENFIARPDVSETFLLKGVADGIILFIFLHGVKSFTERFFINFSNAIIQRQKRSLKKDVFQNNGLDPFIKRTQKEDNSHECMISKKRRRIDKVLSRRFPA